MLKFAIIIAIFAFTNSATVLTEKDLKDELRLTILEAKNRGYEQIQAIKILASSKTENFIEFVDKEVQESRRDMETLKKKFSNDGVSCDKIQDNVDDNALKTIARFQYCIEKVLNEVDYDLQSLVSDAHALSKEIEYAKNVNEELRQKVVDYDARASNFGKYVKSLQTCEVQSSLIQLKRQISKALTNYERCLQKK